MKRRATFALARARPRSRFRRSPRRRPGTGARSRRRRFRPSCRSNRRGSCCRTACVIFLQEDHELPLVRGTARIRGGSREEPAAKAGLLSVYGQVWRTGGTKTPDRRPARRRPRGARRARRERRRARLDDARLGLPEGRLRPGVRHLARAPAPPRVPRGEDRAREEPDRHRHRAPQRRRVADRVARGAQAGLRRRLALRARPRVRDASPPSRATTSWRGTRPTCTRTT